MIDEIELFMVQERRLRGKRVIWKTCGNDFFDDYSEAMHHCAMIEKLGISVPMLRIIKITGRVVG